MPTPPTVKPKRPWFSSGPTAKRPGWTLAGLPQDLLGRGIRAPEVVARFAYGLELTRKVLAPPDDYVLAYIPGSDTGAVESAMWSLLGSRPVQLLAFENFGKTWAVDARDHLKLNPEVIEAPWGRWPDTGGVDPAKDLVFPWNGTTSGVRAPNADFIADDRTGLVICDATSAAFAMPLPWPKLDVTTFSFQKALGGEAGIGVAVLSPRAVQRLDEVEAHFPVPKLLRLTEGGRFNRALATGTMINTFSVLTLEDWIDALEWADRVGGLDELIRRTDASFAVLAEWVARTDWIDFLAEDPATRSTTSVCLKIVDPRVTALEDGGRQAFVWRMKALLENAGAAYDVESHRNAPAGLRLWCGCTVEAEDVAAATPWLDWAFATAVAEL
ncbi:phosphoserine transaminase [Pseudanabaena biceps]|nr:phosphoserine transaminase [Pseudanabaena biceps]